MVHVRHVTNELFLPCKQQADATGEEFKYIIRWLFLPCKQQADATYQSNNLCDNSCFYLANSRQMQQKLLLIQRKASCFYLANSRQMQQHFKTKEEALVVFTLQIVGRCNKQTPRKKTQRLFLPCKQQADATFDAYYPTRISCFYLANSRQMQPINYPKSTKTRCFYLANSRQMQQKQKNSFFS